MKNVFQVAVWIQIKLRCIFAFLHPTHVAFPFWNSKSNRAHVKTFRSDMVGFMCNAFCIEYLAIKKVYKAHLGFDYEIIFFCHLFSQPIDVLHIWFNEK